MRVLHIGNIANNAYNNAKVQREFGIQADVLCKDYYHIMGCPEWEDSGFIGEINNPYMPDWKRVDLNSFKRPQWFYQGPFTFLAEEIVAEMEQTIFLHWYYKVRNHYTYWLFHRDTKIADWARSFSGLRIGEYGIERVDYAELTKDKVVVVVVEEKESTKSKDNHRLQEAIYRYRYFLSPVYVNYLVKTNYHRLRQMGRAAFIRYPQLVFHRTVRSIPDESRFSSNLTALQQELLSYKRRRRTLMRERGDKRRQEFTPRNEEILRESATQKEREIQRNREIQREKEIKKERKIAVKKRRKQYRSDFYQALSDFFARVRYRSGIAAIYILGVPIISVLAITRKDIRERIFKDSSFGDLIRREIKTYSLLKTAKSENYQPDDELIKQLGGYKDIEPYLPNLSLWRLLFSYYDVIQGYSTDPIFPMLAGVKNYLAYEHGTIREIPFEPNSQGRLTMQAYQRAFAVFITNIDNLYAAKRMNLESDRVVCLPHAFDDRKLLTFQQNHLDQIGQNNNCHIDDTFLIFNPSRQHWRDENRSLTKGNDKLIRAFANVVNEFPNARLRLIEWGQDLLESKKLITDLGIDEKVQWVSQMTKHRLWEQYIICDVVTDQFTLAGMSGVSFEALTLGKRVITAFDVELATEFFGKPPPILAGDTVQAITDHLLFVLNDPTDVAGIGRRSADWVQKYHSHKRIFDLQNEVYKKVSKQ